MYNFRNDYSESAHPDVLAAVCATAGAHVTGYGADEYCARCADLIREQCACPRADVQFMVGGTQANFTAVAAFLRPWEAVICAQSGHLNGHEGGAVEAAGHKLLLARTGPDGKLTPAHVLPIVEEGGNDHVTLPRLVYVSDATETGGVYTKAELTALSECCRANGLYLFLDGARLAAAFGSGENDLTLPDLARLCDVFYIGGTKNGALMGEALVIVNPQLQPYFFRVKKQRGAVLAKGWLLGVQFDALLRGGLYWELGRNSTAMAQRLQAGLAGLGVPMLSPSPSNQIFPLVPDGLLPALDRLCTYEFWSKPDAHHTAVRLVTSFAPTQADVDGFLAQLQKVLQRPELG